MRKLDNQFSIVPLAQRQLKPLKKQAMSKSSKQFNSLIYNKASAQDKLLAQIDATTYSKSQPGDLIATGQVLDENNQPLPGANIYVANQSGEYEAGLPGVVSKINPPGNFVLTVGELPLPFSFYQIAVSFIGFETQYLPFSAFDNGPVVVQMQIGVSTLPEVVIYPQPDVMPQQAKFPWWLVAVGAFLVIK